MKVAFIGIKGLPAKGGAERVVEALVKRVTSIGVEPFIYCDARYTSSDYSIEGVRFIRIPTIAGKHLRTLSLVFFSSLHAVLFGRYDLVHLHNIEVSFVLPFLRMKYKVIGTAHGFAYWRSKWGNTAKRIMKTMDYLFVKYSNIVSSVSSKDARELKKRFGRDIIYISNGVGTEFSPNYRTATEILKKHNIVPNQYFIFVTGRMEPTKGAHLAVEAVTRLNQDVPLLILGHDRQSGFNEVKMNSYVEDLRKMAGPKVYFQSFIEDPNTLFGLIKLSTCFIFPSLVEAMSIALLEAASLGVPIICSDIEENQQVLGSEGFYFKSGNVESLIKQLGWILKNQDDAIASAAYLQKQIHSKYSWDNISNQYFEIYKKAICQ